MHKIGGESPAAIRPGTCLILRRTWRESKGRKKKRKTNIAEKEWERTKGR